MDGAKGETQMSVEGKTQVVDVGGYHLLLRTQGTGWPIVILDAGLSDTTTSAEWAPICADVAEFTQCCSYDRVGLGGSDSTDGQHTSLQAVDDLQRLMRQAGLAGPFVLVGHSLGGLHAQLFAAHSPDEVAGLVLIDAAHEDHFDWLRRNELSPVEMEEQRRFAAGDNSERIAFDTALVALQQAAWHLDVPTIVLIRDMVPTEEQPPEWSPEREARLLTTWREVQTDLAHRSQQGRLVVAEASGHNIHRYRPDLIVEAIREVVTSARRQRDSIKGQSKS